MGWWVGWWVGASGLGIRMLAINMKTIRRLFLLFVLDSCVTQLLCKPQARLADTALKTQPLSTSCVPSRTQGRPDINAPTPTPTTPTRERPWLQKKNRRTASPRTFSPPRSRQMGPVIFPANVVCPCGPSQLSCPFMGREPQVFMGSGSSASQAFNISNVVSGVKHSWSRGGRQRAAGELRLGQPRASGAVVMVGRGTHIEIIVHLYHGSVYTGTQALHLQQCELAIGRRLCNSTTVRPSMLPATHTPHCNHAPPSPMCR